VLLRTHGDPFLTKRCVTRSSLIRNKAWST
jgi:hypothetical protein